MGKLISKVSEKEQFGSGVERSESSHCGGESFIERCVWEWFGKE